MATPALIPNDKSVFRGMRNSSWVKRGAVMHLAFLLRPANASFSIEEELSLGLTPESCVDELRENYGAAGLSVLEIHGLPHNLTVMTDPQNAAKANMFGLPLFSTDATLRGLAVAMATDLAGLAYLVPTNPIAQ